MNSINVSMSHSDNSYSQISQRQKTTNRDKSNTIIDRIRKQTTTFKNSYIPIKQTPTKKIQSNRIQYSANNSQLKSRSRNDQSPHQIKQIKSLINDIREQVESNSEEEREKNRSFNVKKSYTNENPQNLIKKLEGLLGELNEREQIIKSKQQRKQRLKEQKKLRTKKFIQLFDSIIRKSIFKKEKKYFKEIEKFSNEVKFEEQKNAFKLVQRTLSSIVNEKKMENFKIFRKNLQIKNSQPKMNFFDQETNDQFIDDFVLENEDMFLFLESEYNQKVHENSILHKQLFNNQVKFFQHQQKLPLLSNLKVQFHTQQNLLHQKLFLYIHCKFQNCDLIFCKFSP